MLVVLDFDVVRRFYRRGRRESRLARLLLPDHADMRPYCGLPGGRIGALQGHEGTGTNHCTSSRNGAL